MVGLQYTALVLLVTSVTLQFGRNTGQPAIALVYLTEDDNSRSLLPGFLKLVGLIFVKEVLSLIIPCRRFLSTH